MTVQSSGRTNAATLPWNTVRQQPTAVNRSSVDHQPPEFGRQPPAVGGLTGSSRPFTVGGWPFTAAAVPDFLPLENQTPRPVRKAPEDMPGEGAGGLSIGKGGGGSIEPPGYPPTQPPQKGLN